jgi:alpha-L-fucosidase
MADGTIPQNQRDCLADIGEWLKVNGEAIYETRPWLDYGEGPNRLKKSGSFTGSVRYTAKDLRYTRSKDGRTIFVTALGWPENGTISPEILQVHEAKDARVELLGHDGELKFSVSGKRLTIRVPEKAPCEHAHAFKLSGFQTSLTPKAAKGREEGLQKLLDGPVDPHKMKPKKGRNK